MSGASRSPSRLPLTVPPVRAYVADWLPGAAILSAALLLLLVTLPAGHRPAAFAVAALFALGGSLMWAHWSRSRAAARTIDALQAVAAVADGGLAVTDERDRLIWHNAGYARLFDAAPGLPRALIAQTDGAPDRFDRLCRTLQDRAMARATFTPDDRTAGRWLRLDARRAGRLTVWVVQPLRLDMAFEAALSDAESRSAPLMDQVGLGFAVADHEGRLRYLSQTVAGWTGRNPGRQYEGLAVDRVIADSRRRLVRADGGELEAESAAVPLTQGDGVRVGTAYLIRSLERERARFGGQESLFREPLIAQAPVGMAWLDRDGAIQEFNPALASFAPNRAPRRGDKLAAYVHAEDRAALAPVLAAALAGQDDVEPVELRFNTQPERAAQMLLAGGGAARPDRAAVYLLDLTQQKSLERQFTQAQKMQAIGQLAGGVAHDFNNLLTAIIGFCDLLLVRHGANDESFADVMQIKQNANRAANLVRQLLAFSRQQTLRPKVLSITDVLAELSNLLRRLLGETIELRMIHGRDLGPVKVDQGQLEQVIINLAVNGRDAMLEGGVLTIRSRAVAAGDRDVAGYEVMPTQDYVLIECEDTGIGIPPEHLNKIFDPFFTTKEVGQGTGLGLSTVYGIIKQTGGFIFVDSEVGQGARFRIYLPVHQAGPEEAVAKAEAAPIRDLTGKGTILLVEDEDAVRMFAARALGNKGYQVLEASTGEAGLEMFETHPGPIDLLISDVVMPGMDGPTLVAKAHERQPELKVIFISGYAEDTVRENLGQADYHFLPKPFSLKQLAETVKTVLP